MPPEPAALLDPLVADLRRGTTVDRSRTFARRAELLAECLGLVEVHADDWVRRAAAAKCIAPGSDAVADEWATGPLPVARYLHGLCTMLRHLARGRLPPLVRPAPDRVRAAPLSLLDRVALPRYRAVVDVEPGSGQQAPPGGGQGVTAVLGAGNVSSMPVGDALHAIAQRGSAVLLKLSPLHRELEPVFAAVLRPLLDADLLRLCCGDADLGRAAVAHPGVDAWHLTGAPATLAALLGDPAAAARPWTAELGNVTPIVVVPGEWRPRELQAAAAQVAGWLQNNAACNCATPRLLLHAAGWSHGDELLRCLQRAIDRLPPRLPFHPGSRARFAAAAQREAPDGPLPFVLRCAVDLDREPDLARAESFAPVLAAVPVRAVDTPAFLDAAAALLRERAFGALAAHVLAPARVLRQHHHAIDRLLDALPHGTIAINTWAAVAFGLGTTPWGTGSSAAGVRTGRGFVHGTQCLASPRRTIVKAPLTAWPSPPWLPSPRAADVCRAMTRLHCAPGVLRAAALALGAIRHDRAVAAARRR